MLRRLCVTDDGSTTIFVPQLNEHYHSLNGAVNESLHVFIKTGLLSLQQKENLHILEIGFGTALNAALSEVFTRENKMLNYTALEPFPLNNEEIQSLNYFEVYPDISKDIFLKLHAVPFDNQYYPITDKFRLRLFAASITSMIFDDEQYDLVYFDAFAPDKQPELWTKEVFLNIYNAMKVGAVLCTYSAKGSVRRQMEAIGFKVERLEGFAKKREMLRAIKL